LLHALESRNLETGIASLCAGGASGLALAVRRL
jgi:acetyl-CoA acetyltransferase